MKRLLFPLLAVLLFIQADAQNSKSNLCKKWRLDFDALMAELPPDFKMMMESLPDEQKAAMQENFDKMKNVWIQFNTNGTVLASDHDVEGETKDGTWSFIDNNSAVKTQIGGEKEDIMDILELTNDKMVVKDRSDPSSPKMTFIPF